MKVVLTKQKTVEEHHEVILTSKFMSGIQNFCILKFIDAIHHMNRIKESINFYPASLLIWDIQIKAKERRSADTSTNC